MQKNARECGLKYCFKFYIHISLFSTSVTVETGHKALCVTCSLHQPTWTRSVAPNGSMKIQHVAKNKLLFRITYRSVQCAHNPCARFD